MPLLNSSDILNWIEQCDTEIVKAWGPIAVGLLAIVIGSIINILLLWHQRKQNNRQNKFNTHQLELSKSKEERNEILQRLDTFYGPFIQLRTQSEVIYRKFESELEKEYKQKGTRFRTLRHLLEGKTLSPQENDLLKQILEINEKLLTLIESSSGDIDKLELQDLLGKFSAHIRILKLAYEKKLNGPIELFEDIVFPLAIDGAIESATERLKYRLNEINCMLKWQGTYQKKLKSNSTIRYYDKHGDEYTNRTLFIDLSELYNPFREQVKRGGRILDAGCGVGRDTRYFIEHGYTVISFDASREMVRRCNEYPHAFCQNMSFKDIAYKEEFDGIWCCSSLLHLKLEEAKEAIKLLTTALKCDGVMFISLKLGKGHKRSLGRLFQYYDEDTVQELYKDDSRLEPIKLWQSKSLVVDDLDGKWLNLLLRKKQFFF